MSFSLLLSFRGFSASEGPMASFSASHGPPKRAFFASSLVFLARRFLYLPEF